MAWQQISVITDEDSAPKLADFFDSLGAVSVTYMDAEDEPVYEPAIGETKIWSNTQVIALYELDAEPELIKSKVCQQFTNAPLEHWLIEDVEDQAWERAWMEYYHPMKFANKLWVCPTGQEQLEPGTVCLILDPGLAFGTGTHPTTALCLEWLASHDLTGKTVIDYGCGSGILAVAAVLLGAKEAHAVDIDPQAITATQDNAIKNSVQDKIRCYLPEQFSAFEADIVLANILAKPLIEMSTQISSLVSKGGDLVLSGILEEQAESVMSAYQPFISMAEPVQQEDWIRLEGIRH
ncbi:MAG: 50S ribosomal protein L11 methyltransferase [Methylococcaceae bacterium]|nr:50S ribosomal protein L11 methyltransferase [Methylococcaceae bacterium]MDZ4155309.1 50S ribosomal protein L11 methyltransferase [Methylococcales bacterium]MDP2393921.1 50S ribosomal protein L11 methyltransferase [Methylococcaceae bacterium]MDP3018091.1 50S ribosomal protein L11 methyltransferase [Methylococcaceae bacterium]MDP3391798.1 50S ribosomal protein L11 methyltransferase [Methylococcaceae bacterium]